MALTTDEYQAQVQRDVGDTGANSIQEVVFPVEADGGTATLTFSGLTTAAVSRTASISTVTTALQALGNIGAGNVQVMMGQRGWIIEFIGTMALQPQPAITADGSSLTPPGDIAVLQNKTGMSTYLGSRIAGMWNRRDKFAADPELQFLWTKLDAVVEFKGFTWTQIQQKTGDEQKNYQDQFTHLADLEEQTKATITDYYEGMQSGNFAAAAQTYSGSLSKQTPSGRPWPHFGRERFGGRCW